MVTFGITVGAGFTTVALRVLSTVVVTGTLAAWPLIMIRLYEDDGSLELIHLSRRMA